MAIGYSTNRWRTFRFLSTIVGATAIIAGTIPARAGTLAWTPGWDLFSEPLDYANSEVHWRVLQPSRFLKIVFTLQGANPSKLYQVGIHMFCSSSLGSFGQFPSDGPCTSITRQNQTASVQAFEFGVVTTDALGNGTFEVLVGPLAPNTYNFEFDVRNGAGCDLNGGGGNSAEICEADFQAPGPFGNGVQITIK